MQNWKIKRMSALKLRKWLTATNELLRNYEKEIETLHCSLCDLSISDNCNDCLWKIIEREDCYDFAYRNDFKNGPVRYDERWQTLRIPMLRRWKKILKIELARRDL